MWIIIVVLDLLAFTRAYDDDDYSKIVPPYLFLDHL